MAFLGGDAKHSVLVKGLDFALLAQQKAKLEGDVEIGDDDLEGAYGSGELKEAEAKTTSEEKKPSKFRPIASGAGFKPVAAEKSEEGAEYIWRNGKRMRKKKKIVPAVEAPEVKASSSGAGSSRQALQDRADLERVAMPPPKLQTTRVEVVATKASESRQEEGRELQIEQESASRAVGRGEKVKRGDADTKHSESDHNSTEADTEPVEANGVDQGDSSDDEGSDIFADAGRWNGLEDDDSEDERMRDGPKAAPVAPVEAALPGIPTSEKRDWFVTASASTATSEGDGKESNALPSNLKNILDNAQEAQKSHVRAQDEASTSEEEEGEEQEPKSQRLEGFSDSVLGREGVRYMLEKEDDNRDDRKRKRKRSKKGKGGYGSD